MTTPCRHPMIGAPDDTQKARIGDQYATRHDPFVYFHSMIDCGPARRFTCACVGATASCICACRAQETSVECVIELVCARGPWVAWKDRPLA
jgi:hypothetical protein